MEVEDQVEFAHVAEVLVQNFHEGLDEFQDDEFVLVLVDDGDEVQAGVPLVDDLIVLVVQEVAHLGLTCQNHRVHLSPTACTSRRNRCFSFCDMAELYHLVSLERPCRLIKKKQWIMGKYYTRNTKLYI